MIFQTPAVGVQPRAFRAIISASEGIWADLFFVDLLLHTIRDDNKALEIPRSVDQTSVIVDYSRLVCEAGLRHKEIDLLPGF